VERALTMVLTSSLKPNSWSRRFELGTSHAVRSDGMTSVLGTPSATSRFDPIAINTLSPLLPSWSLKYSTDMRSVRVSAFKVQTLMLQMQTVRAATNRKMR
jgi:hypothetical protein